MITALQPILRSPLSSLAGYLERTPLQEITSSLFKEFQEVRNEVVEPHSFSFTPLLNNPFELAFGGFWSLWWMFDAYVLGSDLWNLYTEIKAENTADQKFEKITAAAKKSLMSLLYVCWDSTFIVSWADEVKVIVLGAWSPLVKGLGNGASFLVNGIEAAISLYDIHTEKQAFQQEKSPEIQEKHKKRFFWGLIKLVGHTHMIAWSVLGIISFGAGIAFSPLLLGALLTAGVFFSTIALCYKHHLDQAPDPCACPTTSAVTG